LCAAFLRHEDTGLQKGILARFNDWFLRMTGHYERGVRLVMRRGAIAVGVFAAMIVAIFGLFRAVPNSLAPTEDQGYVFMLAILQDAASMDRTRKAVKAISDKMLDHPAVGTVAGVACFDPLTFASRTNAGAIWLPLKPWDERKSDDLSPAAVVNAVFA